MQKIKITLSIIILIILLPILFVNIVILVDSYRNPSEIPSFFSWKPFIVLTGSMEQEISSGDLAIVKEVDTNTLKEGDIIAFKVDNIVITHRIVKIIDDNNEKKFITKGDNNSTQDEGYVKDGQIEGIYKFKIKGLGDIAMFLQTTKGVVLCLSIPIVLLILLQIIQNIDNRREMKQKDKNEKELEEEIERLKKENEEFAKNKKEDIAKNKNQELAKSKKDKSAKNKKEK